MANVVDYGDAQDEYSDSFCFGYLEYNDTLYLGTRHHAEIIADLINQGVTFEELMATRQMWGWGEKEAPWVDDWTGKKYSGTVDVSFSTDEARQDKGIKNKIKIALQQAFPGYKINMDQGYGSQSQETYGDRARTQYLGLRPAAFPDGSKVTPSVGFDPHAGQVGTVMGYEQRPYNEGVFVVQWPDGSNDDYPQWKLRIANVRTAAPVQIHDLDGIIQTVRELIDLEFCFGLVNNQLYLGESHHAAIIANLIMKGMSWDDLLKAKQAWGWVTTWEDYRGDSEEEMEPITVGRFHLSSDDAYISSGMEDSVKNALDVAFPWIHWSFEGNYGTTTSDYGSRAFYNYLDHTGVPDHLDHLSKIASTYTEPVFETHNGFTCYDTRDNPGRDTTDAAVYQWGLCFGAVEKKIYFGDRHHAKIIYNLIEQAGYTFDSLMGATQKWGWIRKRDNELVVTFSTDEAAQTQDNEYSQSVVDAIGEYFRTKAYYEGGEGHSNATNYGERTRDQYYGMPDEGSDEGSEQYCEDCDMWYDPDWESHDHNNQYCENCDEWYDANNDWESDRHDHRKVLLNVADPRTQKWIQTAFQWAKREKEEYGGDTYYGVDEDEIQDYLVEHHDFDKDNAYWVAEMAMKMLKAIPTKPDWLPAGLHPIPTQKILPTNYKPGPQPPQVGEKYNLGTGLTGSVIWYDPQAKKVTIKYDQATTTPSGMNTYTLKQFQQYLDWGTFKRLSHIRVTDLRDAEVFAILSADFIKLGAEGDAINAQDIITNNLTKPIEIGSQWVDDRHERHTVTDVENGRVYYTFPGGHGDMSANVWAFYMTPLSETVGAPSTEGLRPLQAPIQDGIDQAQRQILDPQVENAMKDDPALLAIERNPESKEWRWSMDDDQLHIWRVLNRWQYGPSHYDMFGHEGYRDHSQGRVYVAPDGRVGVLYWQISHPNAEQTLNDWVQKTFGKQPDYVYRAYGPYKGYKTPRWYFPIVEVSGLPIGSWSRWWEKGEKPDQWYYDNGMIPVKKNKGYPAKKQPKQEALPLEDMRAEDINPKKQKRRKRRRQKQYRNRSRR